MNVNYKFFVVALSLLVSVGKISAQNEVQTMRQYVFTSDSVSGFDEQAAMSAARYGSFYGEEFKVFMYGQKRAYIKRKYNLVSVVPQKTLFQSSLPKATAMSVIGGNCDNEDFELATATVAGPTSVQGWTFTGGINDDSCDDIALTSTHPNASKYKVFYGSYNDSLLPFPVTSYFSQSGTTPSGNAFVRINDFTRGKKAVRATKSFIPNANSALFQYAYLPVIEDGTHGCCDQAGFNIKVTVTNTVNNTSTVLACPNISVAIPGSQCQFTIPVGGPSFSPALEPNGPNQWLYDDWNASAIDLTQYIGYAVQIDVTVVDCTASGHGAYFYFDAKCSGMVITGNNNPFPAGSPSVTLPTCGASGATMCATPGLGPYWWEGPDVVPPFNTPSNSNQCFISGLSATYTLYMNPPGSCEPLKRIITTTITPAPLLAGSVKHAGCGDSTAIITVTPSGSAGNPSFINWTGSPISLNSTTTTATYPIPTSAPYNVTVTASDPLGCLISSVFPVNPAPPKITFTITNLTAASYTLTCARPCLNIEATSSYTHNPLTYGWASNSFTSSASNVTICLPPNPNTNTITNDKYVVSATDPVTGCVLTKTINIGTNVVAPTSTVTPNFQAITCTNNAVTTVTAIANPSINVVHMILSPLNTSFAAASYTTVYVPGYPGTYTHVATNLTNGCFETKTFSVSSNDDYPTFETSSSAPNFTLGCGTKSAITVFINNASVPPLGAPATFTLLSPTASPNLPSGPLSTNNTFSNVNVPGTWTIVVRANQSGCETRLPVSVLNENQGPSIDSLSVPRSILTCSVPSTILTAKTYSSNLEYQWSFVGGSVTSPSVLVNIVSTKPTNTVIDNYILSVKNTVNLCVTTRTVPILQNIAPPATKISSTGSLTCTRNELQLTNQSTPTSGPGFPPGLAVGFFWEGPSPQQPESNKTAYTARFPGVYTLTSMDVGNGCTSTGTITVGEDRVYPLLNNPTAPPTPSLDCGAATATVFLNVSTSTTNLSYVWAGPPSATMTGADSPILKTNLVGDYQVAVTDKNNGCLSTTSVKVVHGVLSPSFEADKLKGFAPLTVNFDNTSRTSLELVNVPTTWDFGNGTKQNFSTTTTDPSVTYNQPGTYTVTVFASKGKCIETVRKVIEVDIPSDIIVPNIFTPNGDGVNDLFILQRANNLTSITAEIFDRWGRKVYELKTDKGQIEWDGITNTGKEAPEGTYFYVIKATGRDAVEYNKKGTLTLAR